MSSENTVLYNKIKTHPSDAEARELIEKYRNGDQAAFNSLLSRNQKLVIMIARSYSKNIDFVNDLIQEGNLGFIRAIQKFKLNGSTKLSTYASIWIRSNIETYISKSIYSFKVSQSSRKMALKTFKMYERLINGGASDVSAVATISSELGLKESDVVRLISLKNASVSMQNMKYKNSDGEGQELQDTIPSDISVEKSFEIASLKEKINNQVLTLPEKQKDAVSLFYGLGDYTEKASFANIGRHMNITKEYSRLLYTKGMAELKNRSHIFEKLVA